MRCSASAVGAVSNLSTHLRRSLEHAPAGPERQPPARWRAKMVKRSTHEDTTPPGDCRYLGRGVGPKLACLYRPYGGAARRLATLRAAWRAVGVEFERHRLVAKRHGGRRSTTSARYGPGKGPDTTPVITARRVPFGGGSRPAKYVSGETVDACPCDGGTGRPATMPIQRAPARPGRHRRCRPTCSRRLLLESEGCARFVFRSAYGLRFPKLTVLKHARPRPAITTDGRALFGRAGPSLAARPRVL
jgi:hypothetical protein